MNVLSNARAPVLLPYVYGPLSRNANGHWNQTVESLAQSVLKMYMEMDINLYDRCNREHMDKIRTKDAEREAAAVKWATIKALAVQKGVIV